ncbi:MAG: hypothetical protein GX130_08065 [Candidatus Hydrogenedens sp.]|nr:hypothetical protein [Candidatus Hydrogenedens sp.]
MKQWRLITFGLVAVLLVGIFLFSNIVAGSYARTSFTTCQMKGPYTFKPSYTFKHLPLHTPIYQQPREIYKPNSSLWNQKSLLDQQRPLGTVPKPMTFDTSELRNNPLKNFSETRVDSFKIELEKLTSRESETLGKSEETDVVDPERKNSEKNTTADSSSEEEDEDGKEDDRYNPPPPPLPPRPPLIDPKVLIDRPEGEVGHLYFEKDLNE